MGRTKERCLGATILVASIFLLVGSIYSILISKVFPVVAPGPVESSGSVSDLVLRFLAAVSEDRYYCLLVPLSIPITLLAIYLNWMGLKLFRHNA